MHYLLINIGPGTDRDKMLKNIISILKSLGEIVPIVNLGSRLKGLGGGGGQQFELGEIISILRSD